MTRNDRHNQQVRLRDGRLLGFAEYGDPAGTPLLFFHGWPGSRYSGAETDVAARKLHVRVIAPDRPGIGLSSPQIGRTLLDWSDEVVELLNHLCIKKCAVMGVSGGGPYVAACAYKIPSRITRAGIVVGLAPPYRKELLNHMAFSARIGWANYGRIPLIRDISSRIAKLLFVDAPGLSNYFGFHAREDRLLYAKIVHGKENIAIKEAFRQGIMGAVEDLRVYSDPWNFPLSGIHVPVYLWYGAKDKNVPIEMGRFYHRQIPGSRLYTHKDGGHLFRYEQEEEILRVLALGKPYTASI